MQILLIILLHCFTCINSLSFYNSNTFNSNTFNSNVFISNVFISNVFISKKIKKRRDQQHRIDNLKYLSEHNIPSHTADCNNHEEIFCSISDWNEYNENVKKS
jgi:hypothetical protein